MKKKTLRKIAGLVLSAALCLSMLSVGALAEEDRQWGWWIAYGEGWHVDEVTGSYFYVNGDSNIYWGPRATDPMPTDPPDMPEPPPVFEMDEDGLGWLKKYNGPGGDIVVPDGVTTVGRNLFADRTDVTSVILPDGVIVMDNNVFYGCTNLESVTMGSGLSQIGCNCFRECSSLTSVVVPDGVKTIEFLAFADCPSLTSVTLPESVTYLSGDAFTGSSQVVIYGYTGSYAEDCALEVGIPFVSLGGTPITPLAKELEIRDGFLKGMKVLGMQLKGDLIIPENVTVIGSSALSSQYYLTGITIPATVTTIEAHAMESCRSLTGVTLSNALKRIETYSFSGCTALKSVTIPEGVTYIGDFAFRDCESLTDVTIPGGVTYIGEYAFDGCVDLKSVTVPESVTTLGYYTFDGGTTIYGVTGSAAEAFAKENGNPFVSTGIAASIGELPGLDTASKWARESLQMAYAKGLIPAPLQSSYTQAATRAEFCALAAALYETATGAEAYGRTTFTDTTDVNVEKMAYLGVVTGVGGGRFDPDGKLTREQAATMLARLARVLGVSLSSRSSAPTFADNASIASWAFDAVGMVQAGGVMSGVGNNLFAPQVEYSREQSILTMYRLYELVK